MGRKYLSVIDARAKGTKCKFQLPMVPAFPGIGGIALPPIPQLPAGPTIDTYCPFDDAEEVVPTS